MKNQKKFWIKEHEEKTTFPGIYRKTPSSSVIEFEKLYLSGLDNKKNINILDMGTGNGRNAIYLAEKGFKVTGVDFAKNAILKAKSNTKYENLEFITNDIGKPWKYTKSNSVDTILDVNCSICIREKGRKNIIDEALRTLKKGGLYLFVGVGRTGWCDTEPGPEINSTVFSDSGKFEKQYTKAELLKTFNKFKLVNYISKKTHTENISGRPIDFEVLTAVFEKKN